MPLDANEAPEQSNSWAQDSPGHCHWALTLLPTESSMPGEPLGVYPPQSWHSQGKQRWSNQPFWISPRASTADLAMAMSLLTLPLDVTDSQKAGRKDTAMPTMPKNTQGPALCWLCRQKGQSQPETCTDCSKQRGRVQHLLEGKFNHLQETRL